MNMLQNEGEFFIWEVFFLYNFSQCTPVPSGHQLVPFYRRPAHCLISMAIIYLNRLSPFPFEHGWA